MEEKHYGEDKVYGLHNMQTTVRKTDRKKAVLKMTAVFFFAQLSLSSVKVRIARETEVKLII